MITKYYKEVFSCSAACEEPKKEAKEAEATEAKEEKPKEEKKCVKPRKDINRSEKHMKNAVGTNMGMLNVRWIYSRRLNSENGSY